MLTKMAQIALECAKKPGGISVWSPSAKKYVCISDAEYRHAIAQQSPEIASAHPPIGAAFKLVFITAAGGTLLFVLICVGMHAVLGEKMPPATVKLVDGLIGMAQIGFGAVVGLLGGQVLRSDIKA